jgi:hypothetical protein
MIIMAQFITNDPNYILEYDDGVLQMLHQHGVTTHLHLISQDVKTS